MYPKLNDNISIFAEKNNKFSIFNKATGKTYELGINEVEILKKLDGLHSDDELSELFSISKEVMSGFLKNCEAYGITGQTKREWKWTKIKLPLLNANRLIKKESFFWKLFYVAITYLSLPFFLLVVLLNIKILMNIPTVLQDINIMQNIFLLAIITFISLLIHEFAHAVSGRMLGINIPEIGIMLYWFMPCAYTNVTGIHFLSTKKDKFKVLTAGLSSNLILASLALVLYQNWSTPILLIIVVVNFLIILTNLFCFLKLDGYFLLELFFDEPKLYEKSQALVRRKILNRINQRKRRNENSYTVETLGQKTNYLEELFILLYGVSTYLYIPVLLSSSVINFIF